MLTRILLGILAPVLGVSKLVAVLVLQLSARSVIGARQLRPMLVTSLA